ncbi:hypothetical protein FE263_15625 [Lichenicoccus roseus]|uniref:Uncharacterized protein n=1 Tax=Lichenicoccus roseus TaxID=2683649 RepID=A0A5R9JC64_9PROT|nr:hypothetical protein FE263_15625 [Lichenicoccus roseus]
MPPERPFLQRRDRGTRPGDPPALRSGSPPAAAWRDPAGAVAPEPPPPAPVRSVKLPRSL